MENQFGIHTLAIHAGEAPDPTTGALVPPLHLANTFFLGSAEEGAAIFAGEKAGYVYSRWGNPTVDVLQTRVAALENAQAALATASGMAAISTAILNVVRAGDHIVSAKAIYPSTFHLMQNELHALGIETTFVDATDAQNIERALQPNTKLIYLESPGNPILALCDFRAVAKIAKERERTRKDAKDAKDTKSAKDAKGHERTRKDAEDAEGHERTRKDAKGAKDAEGAQDAEEAKEAEGAQDARIVTMVDNTFATPINQRPLDFGIDVVVHSATKYFGGHGDAVGGVIAGSREFIKRCADEPLRFFGGILAPFNAYLILRGIQTLPLRMERHNANAFAVAQHLEKHHAVKWVSYPGLESHPQHALARKQMRGFGGMVCFELHGGLNAGAHLMNAVKLCSLAVSLGDTRTLIVHPASTTHSVVSRAERESQGVTDGLVRLSVGLEDVDDIVADLERGLD